DDAELTLAQLQALIPNGQVVTAKVEFNPDTMVATKIEVEEETEVEDDDVVTGVNVASRPLQVRRTGPSTEGRGRKSVTVRLLPGTIITKGNSVIRLKQVHTGDHVQLQLFTDRRGRRVSPRVNVTSSRGR